MTEGPPFDDAVAADLVGSIVLVGLTYTRPDGEVTSKFQVYGMVTAATRETGITIEVHSEIWKGQTMTLPPQTNAFEKARPGEYRLRATGETLVDPDYATTWTFQEGPKG